MYGPANYSASSIYLAQSNRNNTSLARANGTVDVGQRSGNTMREAPARLNVAELETPTIRRLPRPGIGTGEERHAAQQHPATDVLSNLGSLHATATEMNMDPVRIQRLVEGSSSGSVAPVPRVSARSTPEQDQQFFRARLLHVKPFVPRQ